MHRHDRDRRFWAPHSIFFKMMGILVVTSVAILLLFGLLMRSAFQPPEHVRPIIAANVIRYADSLAAELGSPPSLEKARALSSQLGLEIRVSGPGADWATGEGVPTLDEFESRKGQWHKFIRAGKYRDRFYLLHDRDGYRYAFSFWKRPVEFFRASVVFAVLGLVLVVLFACLLSLRLLFRPLRYLMAGVLEIGRGNLDYDIGDRCGRDELGRIASAFNHMRDRVKRMIRAREQLLIDVSHELRSPLTRMRLALEFLPESSARASLADDVRELEAMVHELLESERIGSEHGGLRREALVPAELLREIVSKLGAGAPGVRIDEPLAETLITADRERLRTLMKNLIENALKYSARQEKPVELRLLAREGGGVTLEVRDHGPGIPSEDQTLVFEPFYRVDKSRGKETGGYGLGLSLARRIAEAHGGTLTLESAPGRGAVFRLELPA